jgi:hypothetical protein
MPKKVMTEVKSRMDFPALIDELGLKVGVELGVNMGSYSNVLLEKSKLDKLYSIDAWNMDTSVTMAATFKAWCVSHGELELAENTSREVLGKHGDRSVIMKGNSFEAAAVFEDESIDFIFFDAGHRFSGFSLDMIKWFPKIKKGGIIAGHDYWRRYRYEVMDVANAFCFEHRLLMRLTTDDINRDGGGYASPSFWTIKEELSKKEFFDAIPETLANLREAKAKLNKKGVKVVLPYQYMNGDEEGADE